jgi:Bacterial Ig-like domain (group 2)
MHIRSLAPRLAAVLLLAACGEAGHPLDTGAPPPAQAVQALDCVVSLRDPGMRCDSPAPGTGGASGAILGGQNNFVALSSAGMQVSGDTILLDVTIRNLLDQALGTADGQTVAGGGVRVFFEAEPVSQPVGISGAVANASGYGWFTDIDQPYFEYPQVLWPDSTSPPLRWRMVYAPGADRVTFRVYVQAPLQFEDSRNGAAAADSARGNGVRLELAGGGGQTAAPGSALPQPVRVRVLDRNGGPVRGAILNFLAVAGSVTPRQTRTDSAGYASAAWTLGPLPGVQLLRVSGVGGTLVVSANAAIGGVLRLSPDSLPLRVGTTGAFSATLLDGVSVAVPPRTLAWSSSSPQVATVDGDGVVTAVAPGRATVTAQTVGLSATAVVVVSAAPEGPRVATLRIDPASVSLAVGGTARVRAIAEDASGNPVTGLPVRWTSLDSTVARIDSGGVVSGRKAGSTRVRATAGGLTAEAAVTVSAPPVSNGGPVFGGIQILDGPYPVRPGTVLHIQFFSVQDPDGVAAVSFVARAPDGVQTAPCNLTKQDGAIATNALWSCDLRIPANAQHGTWTLDPISARDKLGNVTTHTAAELLARPYPPDIRFFVENLAYDTIPPRLTGLTLSLEPRADGHWLVARFTATDTWSGVYRTGIEISSPGAALSRINTCAASSGTAAPASDTFTCRVLALDSEVGSEIVVTGIGLTDRAENSVSYTTAQLEAAGFPARIAVP